MHFIVKLCEHLDHIESNWRRNSIIMLDNAQYHRGTVVKQQFAELHVPVMFLGPYHFKMAPVELFFSYIKSKDLNPLKSRIPTT